MREIGVGNENAINALVDLIRNPDVDYFTKYQAAESLGKIGVGNENAINALVDLIGELDLDLLFKYDVVESLREIDPGNENAINALVELIGESDVDDDTKYQAAESLGEILTDEHIPIVLKALKANLSLETSNHNSDLLNNYYQIIWKCAQNMTYPEFYQAWHEGDKISWSTSNLSIETDGEMGR